MQLPVLFFFLLIVVVISYEPVTYMDLSPPLVAEFKPSSSGPYTWSTPCYHHSASLRLYDNLSWIKRVQIKVHSVSISKDSCSESYALIFPRALRFRIIRSSGVNTWNLILSPSRYDLVVRNELLLFYIHQSFKQWMPELINTLNLFWGSNTVEHNQEFMKRNFDVEFLPRPPAPPNRGDEVKKLIKPGDILLQYSLAAGSSVIAYGTGGMVSHMCIAVEINGELYITESTDSDPFSEELWGYDNVTEVRRGFVALPFDEWWRVEHGTKRGMTVLLPLKDEVRDRFDNERAVTWVSRHLGTHYGLRNFLYSWIDSYESFPGTWSWAFMQMLLQIGDVFAPSIVREIAVRGIAKRLGNEELNSMRQVLREIRSRRALNLGDVMSIPEQNDWTYEEGLPELMCSGYVIKVLQEAGVFDEEVSSSLVPGEFTPLDVCQLGIYREEWVGKPEWCGCGSRGACQILGGFEYDFEKLPYFNSIKPYPFMNLFCPRGRTPKMKC
ncbi:hypothetical protein GEMRC1_008838 [Eukaryota sp. GEM-RC1]